MVMDKETEIFKGFYAYPFWVFQFFSGRVVGWRHICDKKKEKWKKFQLKSEASGHYARFLLFVQLIILVVQPVSSQAWDGVIVTEADFQSLQAFKHELVDPRGFLRSWNDSGYGACSGGWVGIKCAQGQVIVIQLPWKGLGGRISEKIGQLQALRKLSLHDNFIGGSIPSALGFLPNLRGVQLFNNRFSGSIPPSIGSCPLLQTVDLSNNSLSGTIPDSLFNSTKFYRLNLSFNSFSGSIPVSLTRSSSLTFLALQHNNLSGPIPNSWGVGTQGKSLFRLQSLALDHNFFSGSMPTSLGKLSELQKVSLSHNQITGAIPDEIGRLSRLKTVDFSSNAINGSLPISLSNLSSLLVLNLENNGLDSQIPDAFEKLQNLSVLNLRRNRFNGPIPGSIGNASALTQLDLSQNNLTGEIPSSIADLPNLNSFNVSYNNLSGSVPTLLSQKFNSSCFVGNLQLCGYGASTPCPSEVPSQVVPASSPGKPRSHGRKLSTKDIILIAAGALLIILLLVCCILLCCLIRKRAASKAKDGEATGRRPGAARAEKGAPSAGVEVEAGGEAGGKLVHFDGPMVFTADDLLCATAEIMGKSTYGTVYKATLEDGNEVAVKRLREKITKSQREFETEVNVLGKIRHPNLLALRAYYLGPKGEKLLVFDYMPKGSLAAFLHARGPDISIDWPTRMRIAQGTTRGLFHLHNNENIIHGNLTSSNLLLDENITAKIADFGLSRLMTTAANSNVIATAGALGYRAPELSKLKKASTKTDVYSLGVIILELLTGKSPGEATNGVDLPQWVASIVKEEWTNEVFDLELMKDASTIGDELLNTLKLALHCVDPSPSARPEVHQVLQQLEEIRPEAAASSGEDGAGVPSASD
ncbi:leucine-rich repeat receptor-like protein kinase IMK2 [Vitis vinifera]|uniref:Leucine-rich repeat receptor-like protein kinase IMK2 n=1 Tax=Vitis vinifera TaxID=29760 RepID=A0A438E402_VITVI|nr:leucine-rich repeat receptor-like protein kinase IMK2 [Vitis vinifera]